MPPSIPKQRDIIDRRGVAKKLAEYGTLSDQKRRPKVLKLFKDVLAAGRLEVQRRFDEEKISGTQVVRANSFLMDQIIRLLFDFTTQYIFDADDRTRGEEASIIAVGGYGRGELSPFSDIDLLFLLPKKATENSEKVVESMLYMLWDLGLKVGHSTRTIDECLQQAKEDLTIRTAMLESRWLWGDQQLAGQLEHRFRTELIKGTGIDFVEGKLAERDERHERMGESRYVLEPNLKEGKGGLRDLHTLFWIAKYLYGVSDMGELVDRGVLTKQAAKSFAKAQNFFWTVRCHLHYLTGRLDDRITFDVQKEIGLRMGYRDDTALSGVERFMRHYFLTAKEVGDLTRMFCAVLEEGHKRKPRFNLTVLTSRKKPLEGFIVDGARLNLDAPDAIKTDPVKLIRLFHVAHENDLDIHPDALCQVAENLKRVRKLQKNPEANRLFLDLIASKKNPEVALRWLNESGVLGKFIPEFGKVVAQMQYDMYHVYTTDEHTIQAMGVLHRIEQGDLAEDHPVATEVIKKIQSRRALYAALFFHDIAKGQGGDHAVLGAEIVNQVGPRLGLSPEEVETAAWLVAEHLNMSRTAFKRDVDDPKTIDDFTKSIQSPERLKLLLVLTVADIRAVGPKVWNGWKAGLLRSLYHRSDEMLSGNAVGGAYDQRVEAAQDELRHLLRPIWTDEEVAAHLKRAYPNYWLSFEMQILHRHAELIREAEVEGAKLTVRTRPDERHDVTEVMVYAADHPGVFSRIAGAMAISGASIVDAKIVTLTNGMALDTFWVQDTERHEISAAVKLEGLTANLEKALTGDVKLHVELEKRSDVLPKRADVFTVAPRVIFDNTASMTYTVIEINSRDRAGLLYDVTSELTHQGLSIAWARITTYGERAVDVFYVKDVFGMKVTNERKLKQIRESMLKVLGADENTELSALDKRLVAKS